jgi:hypothetical protein
VVLFGDQHGFQSIQGSLLVFIRDKNTTFLAIKSPVDTGNSAKFAENIPDIGFAQTLVIDKGDGKVAEFVSLDVGARFVLFLGNGPKTGSPIGVFFLMLGREPSEARNSTFNTRKNQ